MLLSKAYFQSLSELDQQVYTSAHAWWARLSINEMKEMVAKYLPSYVNLTDVHANPTKVVDIFRKRHPYNFSNPWLCESSTTKHFVRLRVSFHGHVDITPKYVKAKKGSIHTGDYMPAELCKITQVEIILEKSAVNGELNETGAKRVKALINWIKANKVELNYRNETFVPWPGSEFVDIDQLEAILADVYGI